LCNNIRVVTYKGDHMSMYESDESINVFKENTSEMLLWANERYKGRNV